MKTNMKSQILCAAAMTLMLSACSSKEDESLTDGTVLLEGSFGGGEAQSSKMQKSVSAMSYANYEVYCLSFSTPISTAKSAVAEDGSFSVSLLAGVPFGCFVNSVSTGQPVATLVVVADSAGFGEQSSTTLALTSNVDLGNLELDLEKGQVAIPKELVENATPNIVGTLDPTSLHNQTYEMECVSTGNEALDAKCDQFVAEGNQVFMRIMSVTENGANFYGMGVWQSSEAFQACGGIDMTNSEKNDLINQGIQFLDQGVITAAAYVNDANVCPLRREDEPAAMENIRNYYAAGRLVQEGLGYTLSTGDSWEIAPGCQAHHHTVVNFVAEDSAGQTLIGHFNSREYLSESTPGACPDFNGQSMEIVLKFHKQ